MKAHVVVPIVISLLISGAYAAYLMNEVNHAPPPKPLTAEQKAACKNTVAIGTVAMFAKSVRCSG